MQLALEWTDSDPATWGASGCDGVAGGTSFSQRPCYNAEPRAGHSQSSSSIHSKRNKKESSHVSAYFRRSMVRGDDNIATISKMLKKQVRRSFSYYAL